MEIPTDTDVSVVLEDVLCRMKVAVGRNLVGLYLFGSLVTGDFDRESSDIDLVAVTASDISDGEFHTLERMHNDVIREHRAWDDRLDIIYVSVAALRTFGRHPCNLAIISPGEPFHRTTSDYGWLLNWYVVQEHGIALSGPPPRSVIRPIFKEEFVRAVREQA
jgi:predicted nucleotidyltransferase